MTRKELWAHRFKNTNFLELLHELPTIERLTKLARIKWLTICHDHQLPPGEDELDPDDDDWRIWFLSAGRGGGKTEAAARWTWNKAVEHPGSRILVASGTYSDLVNVCFEGVSGILASMPRELIASWTKGHCELRLTNGTIIRGISADSYERFRGPQFHYAWCDELAAWVRPQEAFDLINLGLRLGQNPQVIVTTTPKPLGIFFEWQERMADGDSTVRWTQASTLTNLANLAPSFKDAVLQFAGTDYGRQEIEGELLSGETSAIFPRSKFKLWPAWAKSGDPMGFPQFTYIVQSWDCATSGKDVKEGDRSACVTMAVASHENYGTFLMVIDVWAGKLQYPLLREKVIEMSEQRFGTDNAPVTHVLVEDASSGRQLLQELKFSRIKLVGIKPTIDKVGRAVLSSPVLFRGKVYLCESDVNDGKPKNWYDDFLKEVTLFPNSPIIEPGRSEPYDDQVDAFSQALTFIMKNLQAIKLDIHESRPIYADKSGGFTISRDYSKNPYAQ